MTEPTLLTRHQIQDTFWNTLVEESLHPCIYAYTWYLDCVSPQWQALVWETTKGYLIGMPLPIRKKLGFPRVHQPLFCQYLGLFSRKELTDIEVRTLFKTLHRHFNYISSYTFHPGDSPVLSRFRTQDTALTWNEYTTHWLNLEKPYDELAAGYKADRRLNLKKSGRTAWVHSELTEAGSLIKLFQDHHEQRIPGGVHKDAYSILRKLVEILRQRESVRILYATLHGEIKAGSMIVESMGTSIYLFNAADSLGRNENARTWLLDRYFQEKAGQMVTFDFESPEVESISQFYESFGAERKTYLGIKKNELPFPFRQLVAWRKRWLTTT